MALGSKDVLVVVDVQVDFVSGALAVPGGEVVIAPINRLARAFDHVIITTDWHPADHISFVSSHPGAKVGDRIATSYGEQTLHVAHCVQGTAGAELDPRLELAKAELIVRKGYRRDVESYGAFYDGAGNATGLGGYLKARGFERVFCVASPAMSACSTRRWERRATGSRPTSSPTPRPATTTSRPTTCVSRRLRLSGPAWRQCWRPWPPEARPFSDPRGAFTSAVAPRTNRGMSACILIIGKISLRPFGDRDATDI